MKKQITIIGIALLATILVGGCVQQPAAEETIKIGVISPITGPFAKWGESINNGIKLALEDVNHKFVVSYEDDACDPKTAVTVFGKLSGVDGIKLILGPGCIECLRAIAPLAEKNGSLLFSTGMLDDAIFEEHPNSVINLAEQISSEAKYAVAFMHLEGVSKVAIVYGTNDFGAELGKKLPLLLEEKGIRVTSAQPTALDTTGFRTVILKIADGQPDAIFIHQGETQIGLFIKQLREMGYDTQVYSYYGAENESVKQAASIALEGIKYTYPFNSVEDSPEKKAFEKRYENAFNGVVPSATSFFVYDGLMLLDNALNECKADDAKCIAAFFKKPEWHYGLSGDFRFNEDGSILRKFGIKTFKDGKFQWLTKKVDLND